MSGMTTGNTGDLRRKEVMMKKKNGMKYGMKEDMADMKAMKKSKGKKPMKKAPAKKKGK